MKRIISLLLSVLLMCAVSVTAVSCGSDYVKRTENELTYYLPKDMTERNLQNIPVAYSNGEATFVMIVWGKAELADEWNLPYDFDITELTEKHMYYNGYDSEYEYDEARGVTTLFAYATEYQESEELDYFYNLIALTESYAYIVTIHCDESLANKYIPIFNDWASRITVRQ